MSNNNESVLGNFGKTTGEYDANQLEQLEGLDVIRQRPTLFMEGLNADGLNRLISEVIDNSFDEIGAGYGTSVKVELENNGWVNVEDGGRGIPVDINEKYGISAVELAFTKLFAGGKFSGTGYAAAGGLHGIGLKCLNAFSESVEVSIWRDGGHYSINFSAGLVSKPLERLGDADHTGTKIRFLPKYSIFAKSLLPNPVTIEKRLRRDAYLNPGVTASFISNGLEVNYCYPNGVAEFIDETCESLGPVHEETIRLFGRRNESIAVESHIRFANTAGSIVGSYVNNIYTSEGGSHLDGVVKGVLRAVRSYGTAKKILRQKTPVLVSADIMSGLVAVVNCRTSDPKFTSQTKTNYRDADAEGVIAALTEEAMSDYMIAHPKEAKAIVLHCMDNAVSREKTQHQKRQLRRLKNTASEGLPPTLQASKKVGDGTELYLIAKTSSWHRISATRDQSFQAVLPMPLKRNPSTEAVHLDVLIEHHDYHSLIGAIGAGIGVDQKEGDGEEPLDESLAGNFAMDSRRYDKIIIVGDNTPESRLARANIAAFLQKYMTPLVVEQKVSVLDIDAVLKSCEVQRLCMITQAQAAELIFSPKNRPLLQVASDFNDDRLGSDVVNVVADASDDTTPQEE